MSIILLLRFIFLMPLIYLKLLSANILLATNKSKKKNSFASINLLPLMILLHFCKNSIDQEPMAGKAKQLEKSKVMLLPEPHRSHHNKKWSNSFTKKPRRNYKNWISCRAIIITMIRRKTNVSNIWITSSLSRSPKNNYKTVTTIRYLVALSLATENQVHPNTSIKRSFTRLLLQPAYRVKFLLLSKKRNDCSNWFW